METRNLVLAYPTSFMPPTDLETIANFIHERAGDIEVYTAPTDAPSFNITKEAARRPTLVFSIGQLARLKPRRGKIYCGILIPKSEQYMRLQASGVRVPRWKLLTPNTRLEPTEWGEKVAIKPDLGWQGRGIQYLKTECVKYLPPENFPERHFGRITPFFVQKFINTGEMPTEFRVLTLFGDPLYAIRRIGREKTPPPVDTYSLNDQRDLTNYRSTKHFGYSDTGSEGEFIYDADILGLAREAYKAVPEIPLQAADIVRDEATGDLYVLELNPGGHTWHFSSFLMGSGMINGIKKEKQFDAFSVAADILIERTRSEAE
jgi:hypothetical protein